MSDKAEVGDFDAAIKSQMKALDMAPKSLAMNGDLRWERARTRLELYKSGKPCRSDVPASR